jgi:hypothetical protein
MKLIVSLCISLLSLSISAQTVTVVFQGAANRSKTQQVVIDGVSYYSTNGLNVNGRRTTTLNNLAEGAHELKVYTTVNPQSTIDGSTTMPATKPSYTKTFYLRQGYDMNITVKPNGLVSFTEKLVSSTNPTSSTTPMSSASFNALAKSITSRRYQSDRIRLVTSAFNTSTNYFTTTQVRQLLSYINAESRRLDLAKLSYARITDRENFSTVYDMLKSEANRDALDEYVVMQGGTSVESTQNNAAYTTTISTAAFTILSNRVRGYSSQTSRITEVRTAFEGSSYFTVPQVKELLTLISSETERLGLAKLAYNRISDRTTFNQLVDLFYLPANRADLNSFIVSNGGVANNNTYSQAMTDASFQQIYNKARSHFFQKNTVADVRTALTTSSNYFTTEQIRYLLQLVTTEATRLELAKLGYARAVDPLNYATLSDLFMIQSNKTDFDVYVRSKQ